MSEKYPGNETSTIRTSNRKVVAGIASLALLAPGSAALAPGANAAPSTPAKSELASPEGTANLQVSHESSPVRLANARVRQSAIRFARTPDTGPAKPGTTYESWVGPNKLVIRNFGGAPSRYNDKGYSITTLAPVLPNGNQNYKKVISTEIRAGNTRVGLIKDFTSGDWYIDYEKTNRKGESQRYVATGDIETGLLIAGGGSTVTELTAKRWQDANRVAQSMIQDLQNGEPVGKYPNPLD